MRCKTSLLLACASLAILASATPQADEAAGDVGALVSTKTATKVASGAATATLGAGNIVAGSEAGAETGDEEIGSSLGTGADTEVGLGSSADLGSANEGMGSTDSIVASGGGDSTSSEMGSGLVEGVSGNGADTGASAGEDSAGGPPTNMKANDGEDCDKEGGGRRPGGEKGQLWSKFAAGNGHPHQAVARGWSDWFKGGNGATSARNGGDRHLERSVPQGHDGQDEGKGGRPGRFGGEGQQHRHAARGHKTGSNKYVPAFNSDSDGSEGSSRGNGITFHARDLDNVFRSGPSWNFVRSGAVSRGNIARGLPVSEAQA